MFFICAPAFQNVKYRIQNAEFRMQNSECRIQNAEFRMQNSECRIQNAEFRKNIVVITAFTEF